MASGIHRLPQTAITGGHLHYAHGERHCRFVLAGHVHEVAAQDAVGVEAQVVVRLTFGRGPRNWADARRHIENGDQGRFVSEPITKALLLWANPFIAVDVESDDVDPARVEAVKGLAKQAIVDRPAKALNIAFFDSYQCDFCVFTRGCFALISD